MTAAQRKRHGVLPEECPLFELARHNDLREAVTVGPFGIGMRPVDRPHAPIIGWLSGRHDMIYRPLTRAARALMKAVLK